MLFETVRFFGITILGMSRLRRLVLSDRFLFVTRRIHRLGGTLTESEFECLAEVVRDRRMAQRFLLTAWVFLRDHWHALRHESRRRISDRNQISDTRRMRAPTRMSFSSMRS